MSAATGDKQTLGFQTEIRQLLDLMIHSLYANREIFLRELISNASDAADKLRFEALGDDSLYEGDGELKVRVDFDADARTITVRDNGIGMDRAEIVENLGTIAKSGTRQFLAALTGDTAEDARLIGQFGVGFYSCFVVADRVTVTSRRAGRPAGEGVRWESTGEGEFTVEDAEVERRGTEVVLRLREDCDEFLDRQRLREIVRRYSDHISLPIVMPAERGEDDDGPAEESVNSATALWARAKNEITDEEYKAFYKHVAHDFEDPLTWVHSRVEGNLEYTSLLFVPSRPPFDLWDRNVRRGVKLYVRRVFVMDDAEQLMPTYLRFVRGVVDSADLPLNVSREVLQNNRQIDTIRAASVKRILDLLAGMAEKEPEDYARFWESFGRVLKEGAVEDAKNRETIAKLLRFASTNSSDDAQTVSLADYVGRMKDGQERIYYITADNPRTARSSPHLEIFREKGVEVLLLTDDVDEWVVHHLHEFDGKHLQSVTRGELDLDSLDGGPAADDERVDDAEHAELIAALEAALGDRVKDVRTTSRLTTSPACLVADDHEMGRHLERILKAAGQDVPASVPILEVNPRHPVVQRFRDETDDARRAEWAAILLDQALLSEGGRLEDPAAFVRRVNEMFLAMSHGGAPANKKKRRASRKKKVTRTGDGATEETGGGEPAT